MKKPIDVYPAIRRYAMLAAALEQELKQHGSSIANDPTALQAAVATLHIYLTNVINPKEYSWQIQEPLFDQETEQ